MKDIAQNTGDRMQSQAEVFTEFRPILVALGKRMLGSDAEAEDIVQEAYVRWQETEPGTVRSPRAFLTTMVTRLCLNHLNLARVRLEHEEAPLLLANASAETRTPAEYAELADALSDAFTHVLGRLSATERAVFLLREGFDLEYADIAGIVDRTEDNCRQILKRARQRIATPQNQGSPISPAQHQRVALEFMRAAETGDLQALLNVLAEDAALCRDPGDLSQPAPPPIQEPKLILEVLRNVLAGARDRSGNRLLACPFLRHQLWVAGSAGQIHRALLFQVAGNKISSIRVVSCPALLRQVRILAALVGSNDFS